jgi:hypothetical protein
MPQHRCRPSQLSPSGARAAPFPRTHRVLPSKVRQYTRDHRPITRCTSARASSQRPCDWRHPLPERETGQPQSSQSADTRQRAFPRPLQSNSASAGRGAGLPYVGAKPPGSTPCLDVFAWTRARSMSCEQEAARLGRVEDAPAAIVRGRSSNAASVILADTNSSPVRNECRHKRFRLHFHLRSV